MFLMHIELIRDFADACCLHVQSIKVPKKITVKLLLMSEI